MDLNETGTENYQNTASTTAAAAAAASTTTTTRKRKRNSFFQNATSVLVTGTRNVIMKLRGGAARNGHGNSNNNHNKKNSKERAPLPGEVEFDKLLADAEYEAYQDPYRGLRTGIQSLETGVPLTTPWNACIWGSLEPEQSVDKNTLDAVAMVRHVGHCACPSLKAWTRKKMESSSSSNKRNNNNNNNNNNSKKKGAGRKRQRSSTDSAAAAAGDGAATVEESSSSFVDPIFSIGLRPEDPRYQCPCDYNPQCLGTLGGVVNDLLTERCQTMEESTSTGSNNDGSKKDDDGDDNENDGKNDELNAKKKPKIVKEEKEEDGRPSPLQEEKEAANTDAMETSPSSTAKRPNQVVIDVDGEGDSKDQSMSEMSEEDAKENNKNKNNGSNNTNDSRNKKEYDVFTFPGSTEDDDGTPCVVRSTPLKPMSRPLQEELLSGNPSEVYQTTNTYMTPQDLNNIKYSPSTSEELKRLRGSLEINCGGIRTYVMRTLGVQHDLKGGATGLTLDKYMKLLEEWYKSLMFMNPIHEERRISGDRIMLSIPPGIENLGATCYLNTQLQCLAQNTAFLNGIFSWREVNSTHRMNSVMTKLQHLLAQMVLGGESKLSTLDFSNALGLEHDEQQDPNEFARLLFERMDESFQQCDGDLSNLLQRIFHGTTTYETVCMECGHTSERSEGFMDLNLPIVKREKKKKDANNNNATNTIKAAFGSAGNGSVDTDVQYCLDQYICAEMLEGDNQYFCSACDAKRDAKRVMKLTELPPVLNVQLSRYVFDREQFVKKKLSDKVLLPKSLYLDRNTGPKKKYLLCAVMRHQGTSAYRGHYVAEAMDWLTGQWFEFNDAVVKLLPGGPSCSFEPDYDGNVVVGENGSKLPSGSQDAYNMYYVSEAYLMEHAVETIQRRSDFIGINNTNNKEKKKNKNNVNNNEEGGGILKEVSSQRDNKYAVLAEMCFQDGLISDRLQRRKVGIRSYLFNDASALIPDDVSLTEKGAADAPVWVGSEFLRRFLRCDSELDDELRRREPILKHQQLLCDHKALHPRTARRGKLMSRRHYDVYVSLIEGERKLLCEQSGENYEPGLVNDCEISPSSNLFCSDCAESYEMELSTKVQLVKNIKKLYDEFDSIVDGEALVLGDDEDLKCPEDGFAYALSRQSVTKYKKCVAALLKTFQKFDEGQEVQNVNGPILDSSPLTGLDAIDISSFTGLQNSSNQDNNNLKLESTESSAKSSSQSDDLDTFFNTNITCSHGNCNVLNNGRVVRFVSWNAWSILKKVYPHAIAHKKRRTFADEPDSSRQDSGCAACHGDKETLELLRTQLAECAKGTKQNPELKPLLDGKRVSRDIDVHNFTCAKNGCRLVHRADIQTWRKALSTISTASKLKSMDIDQLKEFVENTVFPSHHSVVLDFERQPVERLLASLRSLICREHRRAIKNAIFKNSPNADSTVNDEETSHRLSDGIAVLSDGEYRAYVSSLADILHILYPEKRVCAEGNPLKFDGDKPYLKHIERITDSYHPAINMWLNDSEQSSDDLLAFSLQNSSKEFKLTPGVCSCRTCLQEFAPLLHRVNFEDDDKIESISIDSGDDGKPAAKKSSGTGAARSDPIIVEVDIGIDDFNFMEPSPGTFPLRTFEVKEKTSLDETLNKLQTLSALPSENEASNINNFLRRSTRKRQSKYPNGPLLREDTINVGMHHNLAAVRLLMYEKCEVPLVGRKLTLVLSMDDSKPHKTLELLSQHNQSDLSSLVDSLKEPADEATISPFDPSKHLLMLYQREGDADMRGLHESLMDSFLQIANLDNSEPAENKKTKKRNRPSERGFRGTLLSSSVPQDDDAAENGEKGGVEGNENDGTQNVEPPKKKTSTVRLDVSEISDEEKDPMEVAKNPSQPARAVLSDSSEDDSSERAAAPNKVDDDRFADTDTSGPAQVVDDDSSIESVPDGQSNRVSPAKIESPSDDQPPEVDDQYKDFYELMLSMVEQPPDQRICWEAVRWAVSNDPDMSDQSSLVEQALAYYKDNT